MAETEISGLLLVFMLLGFLGVLLVAQRFLPRLGRRFQSTGRLQSLGLLTLTPQCSVAVLRAGREILVLGLTPQAVTLLTKTPDVDGGEEEDKDNATALRIAGTGEPRAAL